jgi:hypothetical protein
MKDGANRPARTRYVYADSNLSRNVLAPIRECGGPASPSSVVTAAKAYTGRRLPLRMEVMTQNPFDIELQLAHGKCVDDFRY